MALTPGARIGPYEVVSAIGAGGMGEVYRARDTKLMAAQVNGQPSGFEVGAVQALFEMRGKTGLRSPVDVTADGQRVLINSSEADPTPEPLTLVVNWTAALRR